MYSPKRCADRAELMLLTDGFGKGIRNRITKLCKCRRNKFDKKLLGYACGQRIHRHKRRKGFALNNRLDNGRGQYILRAFPGEFAVKTVLAALDY